MSEAYLKITTDIKCYIYIDNILKGIITPNTLEKFNLKCGEYWIQLICTEDSDFKIEKIVSLQNDIVLSARFAELYENLFKDEHLIYFPKDRLFRNILTGNPITSNIYDDGTPFQNGIAKVKRNDKWGCIDKFGSEIIPCEYLTYNFLAKEIIPCTYQNMHVLNNQYIQVYNNGKYGLIDTSGKIILPTKFDDIKLFCNNLFWVKANNKWGVVNSDGILVTPYKYSETRGSRVVHNDLWGYLDKSGNEVIPCKYRSIDYIRGNILQARLPLEDTNDYYIFYEDKLIPQTFKDISPFHDGYATFGINGKKGIIDHNGNVVFQCIYEDISYAGEGLFIIEKNGFIGHIDIFGNEIIPCSKYRYGGYFQNGYSLVSITGIGWVFINKYGIEVTPWKYNKITYCGEGLYLVINQHSKIGFINSCFQEVIPCIYDYQENWYNIWFRNGFACLRKNKKEGYIDKFGKEVVPFIFDDIYDNFFRDNDYSLACLGNKCGLIDNKIGKIIIPCKYDSVREIHEGLSAVKLDNKWGFANTDGEIVIPCIYDEVQDFSNDAAGVKIDGKWGYIDKLGQRIGRFIYEDVSKFENDLATVFLGKHFSYSSVINKDGENILKTAPYQNVRYISDINLIQVSKEERFGFLDPECNETIPCIYSAYDYNKEVKGLLKVESNGLWGLLSIRKY